MAIIIPHGLTTAEIRVLQEYRRLSATTLPLETLNAIRHPASAGEGVYTELIAKGYLQAGESGSGFALTEKARAFLAIDAKPDVAEPAPAAAPAAANPKSGGV